MKKIKKLLFYGFGAGGLAFLAYLVIYAGIIFAYLSALYMDVRDGNFLWFVVDFFIPPIGVIHGIILLLS
ncbi:hypothetical protein A7981_02900 [Methylovorus sp. MM2]|uniref:hypothetical protein n=1 Tax=Methylovorus sp. MM2 TaxID=1848038 RepID=UPI0007DEA7A0|nr:hypothetical protein [Methylovorus sp. MM2]OAM52444.1 hypothetical protein A7981_02900 [Methylovorus sp. MM2]